MLVKSSTTLHDFKIEALQHLGIICKENCDQMDSQEILNLPSEF